MDSVRPMLELLDAEDNNRITFSLKDGSLVIYSDLAQFAYADDIGFKNEFVSDYNGRRFYHAIEAIGDDKVLLKFINEREPLILDSGNFEDQKAILTPLVRR
jgi:hypothetical protein